MLEQLCLGKSLPFGWTSCRSPEVAGPVPTAYSVGRSEMTAVAEVPVAVGTTDSVAGSQCIEGLEVERHTAAAAVVVAVVAAVQESQSFEAALACQCIEVAIDQHRQTQSAEVQKAMVAAGKTAGHTAAGPAGHRQCRPGMSLSSSTLRQ